LCFNIQALGNSTNQSIILEALEIEPILPFKSLRYLIQKFDLLLYKLLNLCHFTVHYQGDIEVKFKSVSKKALLKTLLFLT
jgi:hypothetical protein